jgi:ribosomal protein S18 acetylase RimI-like enzyme
MKNKATEHNISFGDINAKYLILNQHNIIDWFNDNKHFKTMVEDLFVKNYGVEKFELYDFLHTVLVDNNKVYFFIIINNNKLISYCILYYYKEHRTLYISTVTVNNEFRNMGVCKKMIKYVINIFNQKKNIIFCMLYVEVNNIPALKCYESIGFKIYETIKNNDDGSYHLMIKNKK